MASCLRRICRKLGSFSFANSRKNVTFSGHRLPENMLVPTSTDFQNGSDNVGFNYNPLLVRMRGPWEEPLIWERGLPQQELTRLMVHFRNSQNSMRCSPDTARLLFSGSEAQRKKVEVQPEPTGKPDPGQLEQVFKTLSEDLPKLFVQTFKYQIYHPNLTLINNIKGTHTVGLYHYYRLISSVRIVGHLKFAFVKLEIIKITQHPEDGTVKVRWRIRGITGFKVIAFFWKYKLWNLKAAYESIDAWYDGFSTYYVGSDGLIYKVVIDKMMPDTEEQPAKTAKSRVGVPIPHS